MISLPDPNNGYDYFSGGTERMKKRAGFMEKVANAKRGNESIAQPLMDIYDSMESFYDALEERANPSIRLATIDGFEINGGFYEDSVAIIYHNVESGCIPSLISNNTIKDVQHVT